MFNSHYIPVKVILKKAKISVSHTHLYFRLFQNTLQLLFLIHTCYCSLAPTILPLSI